MKHSAAVLLALVAVSAPLAGKAWSQPLPRLNGDIPPADKSPPPASVSTSEPAPAPTPPIVDSTTPSPLFDTGDGDSCGGCCNGAHCWRRRPVLNTGSGCATCENGCICGPSGRMWFNIDFLYWQPQGDMLPPLVTTSNSNPLPAPAQAGVLPNAPVVIGGETFNGQFRPGMRAALGGWLNTTHTLGIEAGGFLLSDTSTVSGLQSPGLPILARPFTNATNNTQQSQLIAYPDTVSGAVNVSERMTMNGMDFSFRGNMCCGSCWRLDAIVGYRHLRMTEQLTIQERLLAGVNAPVNIGVPTGTVVNSFDKFDTSNVFNGGQIGVVGDFRWGNWDLDATAKVALGVMDQGVGIDGATFIAPPDTAPRLGGLLALNSNIGAYRRSDASAIPELILNASYQATSYARIRFGYDIIYITNVQRPGKTIDTTIDPARIPPINNPTVNRPIFSDNGNATNLFMQGFHAGVEFRW